jgi:hypothetical protein
MPWQQFVIPLRKREGTSMAETICLSKPYAMQMFHVETDLALEPLQVVYKA